MILPQELLFEYNPFISNIAPKPWNSHSPDVLSIHSAVFDTIKSLCDESVSRSILILGEAGTGKTHLIRRFFEFCTSKEEYGILAVIDPIVGFTPMQHLIQEITTSLSEKGKFGCSQFHMLVARIVVWYLVDSLGKTNKIKEAENNIQVFFKAPIGEKNIAFRLLPSIAEQLMHKDPELDKDVITALFCCSDVEYSGLAKRWFIGENLCRMDLLKLDLPCQEEGEQEEKARKKLITLAKLLHYSNQSLFLCFDQVRLHHVDVQKQAFNEMLKVADRCLGMVPIVFARPDVWHEDIKPYLTPSVLHAFEHVFMLTGCSKEQAKELIVQLICSELADKEISEYKESVVNWMLSEMEEKIRHNMSPREVIIAANQVIDQECR